MFVVIFVVCWAPRHVYLISWHYFDICYNAYWHVFKATGFCLTFIYSAINPFALYIINDQFRRYFDHYLCGRCDNDCFTCLSIYLYFFERWIITLQIYSRAVKVRNRTDRSHSILTAALGYVYSNKKAMQGERVRGCYNNYSLSYRGRVRKNYFQMSALSIHLLRISSRYKIHIKVVSKHKYTQIYTLVHTHAPTLT